MFYVNPDLMVFLFSFTAFDCEIPEVPEGVNHSCQTARDRSYCSLSCMNPGTHAFSESVPQFYKCGLSGLWDPPRGENFTFPACAGKHTRYLKYTYMYALITIITNFR